jgi:hypothetical protein
MPDPPIIVRTATVEEVSLTISPEAPKAAIADKTAL